MLTSDEGVDAKTVDKVVITFLRACEQFGYHIQVGIHLTCSVQHSLSDMNGSVVTVVDAEPIKDPGTGLGVAAHVLPQPG